MAGTEETLKDRRHAQTDIDATIRSGLEEAIEKLTGEEADDEAGHGEEQEGRVLHGGERPESEQEERPGEPAGSEAELDGEEDEGGVDEDDGSVGEGEAEDGLQLEAGEDEEGEIEEEDEEGREASEVDSDLDAGEIEPPDYWPDDVKSEFSKMPPKSQEFYMNSHKGMQADYTNKMQGIAEVHKAIDPVRDDLVKTGVSEGEMIRRFVAVHKKLEDDPVSAVRWIANMYGVKVPELPGEVADDVPPKVAEIDERVKNQEVYQAIERAKAVNVEVEKLKSDGKMPLYAEAEPVMMQIVQQLAATGQQLPGVMDIYERAIWNTPQLREKHLAQSQADDAKRKIVDKKKDVAKSKRAAGKTTGTSRTVKKKRKPKTLRDELSARYDEAARSQG